MELIKINAYIICLILGVSIIGFLIDKFGSERFKKDHLFIAIKNFSKKNPHWILLYLLLFSIVFSGLRNILEGFIEDDEKAFEMAFAVAGLIVSIIFYLFYKNSDKIRSYKTIVKLAAANDRNFIHKLSRSNLNNYIEDRDIPLALILDKQGVISGFVDWSGPNSMDNFLERSSVNPEPELLEVAKKEIRDMDSFGGYRWFKIYDDLKFLDSVISESSPTKLIEKYKRSFYFLRLNIIEMTLPYIIKEKYLILGESDKHEKPVNDFCKLVLNNYYTHEDYPKGNNKEEYVKQPTSFNIEELEKYLENKR
ncbi:MAG: hypothetical protein A4E71_02550 [Smithella sp. PtaU1.Bin162]|nr:MAG: hypothetical protein A4E71_02550 [Smithella sp. PtaU1.Bin162]